MPHDVIEVSPVTASPLIRIRDAVLEFKIGNPWGARRDLRVLDDVSLDVNEGEIIALLGESGSGKTTLGKAMLGLHPLTSGSIEVEPPKAAAPRRQGAHDLQMVFQDPLSSFNPRFTIGSSIALPLRMQRKMPEERIVERVAELLGRVGLNASFADRYPHEMSGGQLQRAAIARALALSPRLIVADEAVSKLDVSVRAQILNLIKSLNRSERIAFVFITHDLGVAQFLADRVAVMYFGRIVELGPVDQVMDSPRHPYTAMLMNARKGQAPVADEAKRSAKGCNFANRCPRALGKCHEVRPEVTALGDDHEFRCFNPV
ncbi:ATP-binding cassette domain-containing protein [Azospirillum formosense]|uniref:ATP-binding cassette domain-containing protein n=1 Tax=Azospirillum formosense TaxID=861533 RepID=A0ABX2L0W7_9PROT|nr:oligopeptide/dipeptide ABC transporter ATP-binding protein [Azospirillum formosense]MBY3756367.1 ABC transporter ATP-binding protein [Azospirillum formosense]NUB20789.1 ATP-binding cassette domain-containing protein [Azospirillum formosense]